MTLSATMLLALALQTPAVGQTPSSRPESLAPTDSTPLPTDSYADPDAAVLMARTRSYAESTKSGIESYRMLSRYAVSVGLSTGQRDRLLYKREVAWRISWRRNEEWRVDVLGSRELLPLVRNEPSAEGFNDGDEIGTLDPDFILGNRGQWVLRLPTAGSESNDLQHPLAPGSERHYRFATGDTTRIAFPGSESVTLIELRVTPRRASSRLLNGSYWLDATSGAPVRAAFRLASPARIEMEVSARRLLPWVADAFFDVDYLTLEYALWQGRWWLPRLLSVQGHGHFGGVDIPLLVEQTFEEVELFADDDAWSPLPPPDTLRWRKASAEEAHGEGPVEGTNADVPASAGSTTNADSLVREIYVLRDDTALVNSPYLPASAFNIESSLTNLDLARIRAALESSIPTMAVAEPEVAWSPVDPGLLRYNRVEGLSIGSSLIARYGQYALDAAVRLGLSGPTPSAEIGWLRTDRRGDRSLRAYSRIEAFSPRDRPLASGNSVGALLFGRDEGDYFRATGLSASIRRRFSRWNRGAIELTAFAEHQTTLERNTGRSLRGGDSFRANPVADRASQLGLEVALETRTGVDADNFRGGITARVGGEVGDFVFARGSLESYAAFPLPGPFVGSFEGAVGQILGEPSVQSIWQVGGSSTVRGFDPDERISGNTFWRSRGEIATERPSLRGLVFVDAGRAANDFTTAGPQLISAGVGVSAMDGLLRADIARALRGGSGWGVQLYLDAPL